MPWVRIRDSQSDRERFFAASRRRARFLVDENLNAEAVAAMRTWGWNLATVEELGLGGHDDRDVYGAAWRERRILLTHDGDFLDDRRFPPNRNPGVVVLPGGGGAWRSLDNALGLVHVVIRPSGDGWRGLKARVDSDGVIAVLTYGRAETRYRIGSTGYIEIWQDPQ